MICDRLSGEVPMTKPINRKQPAEDFADFETDTFQSDTQEGEASGRREL